MYKEVKFNGVSCFTDAYVARDETLYMISLFGPMEAVKAVAAAIATNETVFVGFDRFATVKHTRHTIRRKLISRAVTHCMLINQIILNPECLSPVIIGEDHAEIVTKLYRHIDHISDVPFLPEWKYSLYELCNVSECEAFGLNGRIARRIEIPRDDDFLEFMKENHLKLKAA